MKKAGKIILILCTVGLFSFLLGFHLGRNTGREEIQLTVVERTIQLPAPDFTPSNSLVNINTATKYELMSLPGIGETIAQRIIDYRIANGPYPDADALLNVEGIGEGTMGNILDYITTGG